MKIWIGILSLFVVAACNKVIEVELPPYHPEMVVEMYLEDGKPLRCLVSESLPYTDSMIKKPLDDALVIFSDGVQDDTLVYRVNEDADNARWYNYFHPRILRADPSKTYSLRVTDSHERSVSGTTRFSQQLIDIDSLTSKESEREVDTFTVGVMITDPAEINNYYRFVMGKRLNDHRFDQTDFTVSDVSFNGKKFSFYSEGDFARNDTVTVRLYSLQKEHYDYIQSVDDARGSNFNPLSQPGKIKSNVSGGIGIFTTIRYAQKQEIVE
jgi:hypothetical protein